MDYKVGDKVKVVRIGAEVPDYKLEEFKGRIYKINKLEYPGGWHRKLVLIRGGDLGDKGWWLGPECLEYAHDGDDVPVIAPIKEVNMKRIWKMGDEVIIARPDERHNPEHMNWLLGKHAIITHSGEYIHLKLKNPEEELQKTHKDSTYYYFSGKGFDPVEDKDMPVVAPIAVEEAKEAPAKLKYKAGDKLLCIDAKNKWKIKEGHIYPVVECKEKYVRIINDAGEDISYDIARFKKATPAIIRAYEADIEAKKQAEIAAKEAKELAEKLLREKEEALVKHVGYAKLRAHVMERGEDVTPCTVHSIQYDDGSFDNCTTACHASIGGSGYGVKKRIALAENIDVQHRKAVLIGLGNEYKRYANYIINESPVRDCFIPQGIDNGLKYGVLYNVNRPIEELIVAANQLREGGEFCIQRLKLFCELLDQGFSGKVAYLLSYCVSDRLQYRGFDNSHKSMSDFMDAEATLKWFRDGFVLTKGKKPYNQSHGGYSGISCWIAKKVKEGEEAKNISTFMKKGLKVGVGGGGFGGGGAAVTKENLYSFAVILESKVSNF